MNFSLMLAVQHFSIRPSSPYQEEMKPLIVHPFVTEIPVCCNPLIARADTRILLNLYEVTSQFRHKGICLMQG